LKVNHIPDIYLMWYMQYMTKVESWNILIDQSYRPETDIK
jgi:hypothetical protein